MKQHITIDNSVHFVMIVFAAASIANVSSFFVATGHNIIVALSMATALGTAVATTAIMLTMIDMVKQRQRYIAVGAMVLCLVGVSGFVQMQGYLSHGLTMSVSAAMGFGIVFSGECLTAIALSLYRASERRRMLDEADTGLEIKLAETFAATLDSIDVTNSAKYMQRHIDTIVRHKADTLMRQYVPQSETVHETPKTVSHETPNDTLTKEERHTKLIQIISKYETPECINKTDIASALGVSRATINRDFDTLETTGRIYVNGTVQTELN